MVIEEGLYRNCDAMLGKMWLLDTTNYSPDLEATPAEKIFYTLTMFPYPSGVGLHCGHASIFTINDIVARYKRMQGYVVLNPFGFDAFGLPTENYAMELGKPAYEVTEINEAKFIDQVKALNLSFDRERVIDTSKPDYYKWTQRIFSKLYQAWLVYRANLRVNRCPLDQTVLANDQVEDGRCERCKTEIVQKKMPQRFIKITAYADRLIQDLDTIDRPEETKIAQRNWIGRSEGAEIDFQVAWANTPKITVFTTRPDTIYWVTAVVLAPENTFVDSLLEGEYKKELDGYRQATFAKTPVQRQQELKEKTWVFSGLYTKHPLTWKDIPIRFADYVVADYGSGAVMMVPAHDERDFEFAKKFGIEIIPVIAKKFILEWEWALRENVEILNRRVVDAILENDKGEILVMKESNSGDIHFIGWGIEQGETEIETLGREIIEESGYTDFEILNPIHGGTAHVVWFRHTKQKNQVSIGWFFHAKLTSENKIKSEADEGKHNLQRLPKENVLESLTRPAHKFAYESFLLWWKPHTEDGTLINSWELDGLDTSDGKVSIIKTLESLGKWRSKITYKLRDRSVSRQRYRGSPIPVYYKEPTTTVPLYEYQDEARKYRPGLETLTRNIVQIIVKDEDSDEYLFIKRKHDGDISGFFGWIEEGESVEDACRRELKEEAWIESIEIKKHILEYHCKFRHPTKKRNQYSIGQCLYVEVDRNSQKEISSEEKLIHDTVRMSADEFLKISKNDTTIYCLQHLLWIKQTARPMINEYNEYNPCPEDKKIPCLVPENELPVVLPLDVGNYKPKGKSPLEEHPTFAVYEKDWVKYHRECDTLDTFMCSSFYFLRFPDAHNDNALISKELAEKMFPINFYSGGKENTVWHLLYSRFIHKFLYDQGYVPSAEPFEKLIHQGMVLGKDGRKMGKRYNNGVDPMEMIDLYWSDALRVYLMFMGPVEADKPWIDNALQGVKKFLERIERLTEIEWFGIFNEEVESKTHQTIRDITQDLEEIKFNTAVSKLMILTNAMYDNKAVTKDQLSNLALLIAPFAPMLSMRLRKKLWHTDEVHYHAWPVEDRAKILQWNISLPIQINGKMRGNVEIHPWLDEANVIKLVHLDEQLSKHLAGQTIKKIIYVQDKILNIVVG